MTNTLAIQPRWLRAADPGALDNIYARRTIAAVKSGQSRHNLTADGAHPRFKLEKMP